MTARRAACVLTFLATLGLLAASAGPAMAGCTQPEEASTVKRSLSRRLACNDRRLAPTFAELAGVAVPIAHDGVSLVTVLDGTAPTWRTDFLTEGWPASHPWATVREVQWKYTEIPGERPAARRPHPRYGLPAAPAAAELARRLRSERPGSSRGRVTAKRPTEEPRVCARPSASELGEEAPRGFAAWRRGTESPFES